MTNLFYAFISSTDSLYYFSENKPYQFTVYFPEPISFKNQTWTLNLLEIEYSYTQSNENKNLEIYCDITNEAIIHGTKRKILRKITLDNKADVNETTIINTFSSTIPMVINRTEIVSITIYIRDEYARPATFLKGKTDCTLEFKKVKQYKNR